AWVRQAAIVLGIVPALASAVYKGVLLSTTAQPGWKDARWLGGYLTSGAVVLGCAEMIVLAYLTEQPHAAEVLRPALGIVLVVHAVPLLLLAAELRPVVDRALTRGQRLIAITVVAAGGLLLPLALVTVGGGLWGPTAAAFLILLGNLAARFVLVQLPRSAE